MVKNGKVETLRPNKSSVYKVDTNEMFDSMTHTEYISAMFLMFGAIIVFFILIVQLIKSTANAAIPPPTKLVGAAFNVTEREVVTGRVTVIDGDTISIKLTNTEDGSSNKELVRLYGVDAPEVKKPHCIEEELKGETSKNRLTDILGKARKIEVERLKSKDKYGRTLANVYADGKNIQFQLVVEGMAKIYNPSVGKGRWCNLG